jgi:ankyrin repeat protein
MLLDQGAGINAHSGNLSNALQAASKEGHRKVVQMLLDQSADVNAPGRIFSTGSPPMG